MTDRANQAAANANGMHACPACGDWLPLSLTRFRCGGRGNHIAMPADPVLPLVMPATTQHWADRALLVVALAIVLLMAVAVMGMLFPRHQAAPVPVVGHVGGPS